jgi:hypothetical protein
LPLLLVLVLPRRQLQLRQHRVQLAVVPAIMLLLLLLPLGSALVAWRCTGRTALASCCRHGAPPRLLAVLIKQPRARVAHQHCTQPPATATAAQPGCEATGACSCANSISLF